MKIFSCAACHQTVYFENVRCTACGHTLGFSVEEMALLSLEPAGDDLWEPTGGAGGRYRLCANSVENGVCNWLVAEHDEASLCRACRLNRTIPDLGVAGNVRLWGRLEAEKRRLAYGLLRLGLPLADRREQPETGLAFDFLADPDPQFREGPGVTTGHAGGVITINLAEADDAVRERMRQQMAEPYRTILGHFRHESGHYYWERLVRDGDWLQEYRDRFGDETADYAAALGRHYRQGPPGDWQQRCVSAYASSHPWEDWAESWAHYLHLVDTLETAWQFRLRVRPRVAAAEELRAEAGFDPYACDDFDALLESWLPLTYALNSLNRSMGQPDLYPFVLAPPAVEKLRLVHRIVRHAAAPSA